MIKLGYQMKGNNKMNNRKVLNIMREFLYQAMDDKMDILVDDGCDLISFEPLVIHHGVRPVQYRKPRIYFKKDNGFNIYENDDCDLVIGYDENYIYNKLSKKEKILHKAARKSFTVGESHVNGFSTITLILLHELGHMEAEHGHNTDKEKEFIKKMLEMYRNDNRTSLEYNQEIHFNLPAEIAATSWAIEWLRHPKNAKIAKEFERKYFKYIKER